MSYTPKRVQRRREKGYRTPLCGCGCGKPARYVGRPTKWGNPAIIGQRMPESPYELRETLPIIRDAKQAVEWYSQWMGRIAAGRDADGHNATLDALRAELAGHDLACYCPPDQPCHADILLALANPQESQP